EKAYLFRRQSHVISPFQLEAPKRSPRRTISPSTPRSASRRWRMGGKSVTKERGRVSVTARAIEFLRRFARQGGSFPVTHHSGAPPQPTEGRASCEAPRFSGRRLVGSNRAGNGRVRRQIWEWKRRPDGPEARGLRPPLPGSTRRRSTERGEMNAWPGEHPGR